MKGTDVEAQVPFYVKESIVPFYNKAGKLISMGLATADLRNTPAALAAGQAGVGSHTFKAGQEFTISIKGVGWTQLDNTLGVTYDNSYIGYSCGFNSNGYMVVHLKATGGPGTHLIDLYPMLYSLSPSFATTPYGMVPTSRSGSDYPGLALGYQVPSSTSRSRSSSRRRLGGRRPRPLGGRGRDAYEPRRRAAAATSNARRAGPSRSAEAGRARRRVEQHAEGEPDAELLEPGDAPQREAPERAHHDERGGAHDPAGARHALEDRLRVSAPASCASRTRETMKTS